jgi:RNA polymerase sigma factor (sigma-70 family)
MAVMLSPTSVCPAHDEPELVAATRGGDDRAFGELYARYRERIFAFIVSRVHDHGRAEDIAQDVFMSALRRMRSGDQEIAFKPWIYEIAKNACIDEYRRGHRSREVSLEADPDLSGEPPAVLSRLPTPPAAVESKQRLDDLRGAFGGLSETHHQLLVLREFEGLSYDEIGDRLGMTRHMVESGLFRARRKLSEEYQELASGRRCEQVQFAIEGGALASARALGIRERRRFARHLSHCQACRHVALQAGVDDALVRPRSIAAKIAALLPFPLARLRWPWGRGRGAGPGSGGGSHQLTAATLQNAPVVAEQAGNSAMSLGPAAVAAAALTIAGVGGTLLHNAAASGRPHHPVPVSAAATAHRAGAHRAVTIGSSSPAAAAVARLHALQASSGRHGAAGGHSTAASRGTTARHVTASAGSQGSHGTAGIVSRATTAPSGVSSAATPVKQAVSGVGSTTQHVGSTTQHVVSTAGGAVGKLGSTVSKTVQGVAGAVKQTTSSVTSSLSPPSSGQGSGSTSPVSSTVSSVAKPATKVVGQVTKTVSQVVPGLP